MKKLVLIILFLIVSNTVFAEDVIVEIPEYDITVNGEVIDTKHSQYPVLIYKDITYFPMTSDYLSGLGLNLNFSHSQGFMLNKKLPFGIFEQKFLGASNVLKSKHKARVASFNIEVNGSTVLNTDEKYPVLLYKNITYFPMTWRFAVEEFGWKTNWSNKTGFSIVVEKSVSIKSPPVVKGSTSFKTDAIDKVIDKMIINGKNIEYTAINVDLNNDEVTVKTALANEEIGSVSTLEEIALENNALLAINGSYFSAYDENLPKDPYGILVVDGKVVHNMNDRATIGFKNGQVDIDRVDTKIVGVNTYNGKKFPWYGWWINHTAFENGTNMTVYDSSRGSETLSPYGTNYIVDHHKIVSIVKNASVKIPENGYVVNIQGTVGATPTQVYDRFSIGYTFDFDVTLTPENNQASFWKDVDYATGAGPALILDGKIDIDYEGEHFVEPKIYELSAARSAIGYTTDNQLVFVTTTATVDELAVLMLNLGCYEAMNLDGGASSGLWYDGNYLRTPGRDISNIIYVELN